MKERSIIFGSEMVRAILEGRKTQTRRVMKPQPNWEPIDGIGGYTLVWKDSDGFDEDNCPYGKPGDRLWVRETWAVWDAGLAYKADCLDKNGVESADSKRVRLGDYGVKWKSPMFMPRWASRIVLDVVSVRVERLQAISEADTAAEGVEIDGEYWYNNFRRLWDSINAKRGYPWESNPWVWVIEFERVTK